MYQDGFEREIQESFTCTSRKSQSKVMNMNYISDLTLVTSWKETETDA